MLFLVDAIWEVVCPLTRPEMKMYRSSLRNVTEHSRCTGEGILLVVCYGCNFKSKEGEEDYFVLDFHEQLC